MAFNLQINHIRMQQNSNNVKILSRTHLIKWFHFGIFFLFKFSHNAEDILRWSHKRSHSKMTTSYPIKYNLGQIMPRQQQWHTTTYFLWSSRVFFHVTSKWTGVCMCVCVCRKAMNDAFTEKHRSVENVWDVGVWKAVFCSVITFALSLSFLSSKYNINSRAKAIQ